MKIVWDEIKRRANILKHGMDFADLDSDFFLDAAISPTRETRLRNWPHRSGRGNGKLQPIGHRGRFGDFNAARKLEREEGLAMTRPTITKPLSRFKEGMGISRADWDCVENPPATDEELAQARPFAEIFPDLAASIKRSRGRPATGKAKQVVSIRLDQDVIAKFKATGDGWHARINDVLRNAKV